MTVDPLVIIRYYPECSTIFLGLIFFVAVVVLVKVVEVVVVVVVVVVAVVVVVVAAVVTSKRKTNISVFFKIPFLSVPVCFPL
jgi:hypothetical protein